MIRVRPRLSRILLATAIAAAVSAGPALAAPMYLKIKDIDGESKDDRHKDQIEILSWSWGETRKTDTLRLIAQVPHAQSGEKGGTEDINIGVGELQEATISKPMEGTASPGEAEITLKGRTIGENAAARSTPPTVTLKRGTSATEATGGVQVAAGDLDGDGRAEAPRKPTTSPATITPRSLPGTGVQPAAPKLVLAQPLASGSVRVKVRFPWMACRVGAAYPELELSDGARAYKLKEAIVTSCSAGEGARPMEEIAFNYSKVEF